MLHLAHQTLINGLLAKRQELTNLNAELREKMGIVANDIGRGTGARLPRLPGPACRQHAASGRIVLFYRNELREYLIAELRKSAEPLTGRELAQRLCQVEGKDWQDRRLLTDVVRRVGCALRKLRASRVVEGERTQAGAVWRLQP